MQCNLVRLIYSLTGKREKGKKEGRREGEREGRNEGTNERKGGQK